MDQFILLTPSKSGWGKFSLFSLSIPS